VEPSHPLFGLRWVGVGGACLENTIGLTMMGTTPRKEYLENRAIEIIPQERRLFIEKGI